MTGLELMQAMLDGKLPPPSIATTIPMQLQAIQLIGAALFAVALVHTALFQF